MITPKERLEKVVKRDTVDRAPCICPGGMMNMVTADLQDMLATYFPLAHSDARMMATLAKGAYDSGCFENVGVPFCMCVEAEAMGATIDMGSQIFEPHVVEYPIDSVDEYQDLIEFNLDKGRLKTTIDAIKILKTETDEIPIIGNITGPLSVASSLMEPTKFYKELRKKNKAAHEFLNFVTEQLIDFIQAMIDAGANVIAISDPSGTGEILGPKYFQEFLVTYMNKLLSGIKSDEIITIVHICGQMKSVYHEVNQVTSDVLSFDSIVPIDEARENLSDRILMGNVSTYALEYQNRNIIRQLTKNCLKRGSNIISPACGLGMRSPLINIQEMLLTVQESEINNNEECC